MKKKTSIILFISMLFIFISSIIPAKAYTKVYESTINCNENGTKTFLQTENELINVNNIGPGDSYCIKLNLTNNTNKDKLVKLLKVESLDKDETLYRYLNNEITDVKNNRVIFSGTLNKFQKDNGTLNVKAHSKEAIIINIQFPHDATNEYQGKPYNCKYTFQVEDRIKDTVTDKPIQTGIITFSLIGSLFGLCISILFLLKAKKQEKDKEQNKEMLLNHVNNEVNQDETDND